jgi:hypothetical protein
MRVVRKKNQKVLPTNCGGMHGNEDCWSTEAAACLPWEEFGFGALVRDGLQMATGAVCRGKIRKVLKENRAWMHGEEVDTSNEPAACNSWDELGSKEYRLSYFRE